MSCISIWISFKRYSIKYYGTYPPLNEKIYFLDYINLFSSQKKVSLSLIIFINIICIVSWEFLLSKNIFVFKKYAIVFCKFYVKYEYQFPSWYKLEYKKPVSVINVQIKHSKFYSLISGLVLSYTKTLFLSKYLKFILKPFLDFCKYPETFCSPDIQFSIIQHLYSLFTLLFTLYLCIADTIGI